MQTWDDRCVVSSQVDRLFLVEVLWVPRDVICLIDES